MSNVYDTVGRFNMELYRPPEELIKAARMLKDWHDERGIKNWSIDGVGRVPTHIYSEPI